MKLLARVEDFFELIPHSSVTVRFLAEDGRIREKEKIQLRTPDGQVTNTYVAGIWHVKYLPLTPRDPNIVHISLPPEIKKQDVPSGTEIWSFR